MPIGIDRYWTPERFIQVDEMKKRVESQGFKLTPVIRNLPVGGGPAQYWQVTLPEGGPPIQVGFIAALSHNFCRLCNRVRLTSDGRVRECLTGGGALSLRDMLRDGATDSQIETAIKQALYGKIDGHGFDEATGGLKTRVPMSALGG
jgi:cyclic pyranopterin phosphate synthase